MQYSQTVRNKCNIDLLHYIFMLCFIQLYRLEKYQMYKNGGGAIFVTQNHLVQCGN